MELSKEWKEDRKRRRKIEKNRKINEKKAQSQHEI